MQFFRGDTFEFDFSSSLADGEAYVFQEGDILKVGVKEKLNASRYLLFKEIEIEGQTELVTISFTAEETRKCKVGKKILEVELTDNSGRVRTLYQDNVTIKEDLINE